MTKKTICANCLHYKLDETTKKKSLPFTHNCLKKQKESQNFITGKITKTNSGIIDCESFNTEGTCLYYTEKIDKDLDEMNKSWEKLKKTLNNEFWKKEQYETPLTPYRPIPIYPQPYWNEYYHNWRYPGTMTFTCC